ncbi:hypothetical protein [Christiangramia aquimixticola]|uniref:hypothetical protein n=1 Tax=Christiangramia aquimixticola TaxID=1697558 RepID=UPI003AA7D46B
MNDILEYLSAVWPLTPLLFFILAVSFRLLDNSTSLFLQKDILVCSSNVSKKLIKQEIDHHYDPTFKRKLKFALIFKRLHQVFLLMAASALPVSIFLYFLQ